MKSQLTLVAAVFFGAMGGSFLTRIIEPAEAEHHLKPHCHLVGRKYTGATPIHTLEKFCNQH